MKKKQSIHDIAKHLKVSATTVSFVLNGKTEKMRISDAVKERVLKYIKEINYQPNLVAKSLRTGKSHIIGMMVEDIADPFFASIARRIEHKAYELGYIIFFASTENDTDKAKALINVFRERQVDAYIIAPPPGLEAEVKSLIDDGKEVIFFDRVYSDCKLNSVIVDNYAGTAKAIEHLQQNGFKNIGFVTLESDQTQMHDRLQGYLETVKNKNPDNILKVPYLLPPHEIKEMVKAFLLAQSNLDAIFFSTNYLTLSGLEAITEVDLKIPTNLAVVSFDDSPVFNLYTPAITAVAQPTEKIAEAVINKLINRLNKPTDTVPIETIIVPTELMIRSSTASN